ncbi:MAG: glycosyltransferase family 8 protein [Puniceicoccales bacterium]|nr:glycosyltransferase family 8 protein [Puniceicoccales bacterium]
MLWVLLLLICPMRMAAAGDTLPSVEIQNVAYGENADDVIPVVLVADNNYGPQMYITMLSILKNSNADTRYDFYLLVPSDFEKRYENFILELGDSYGCKVNFVDMGTAFSDVPDGSSLPSAAYYRLLAPNLLSNYSKCVYLDTDIVVRHDLGELFNTDLEDCYIAGVKDMQMVVSGTEYLLSINLHDANHYINSGVLVMNLDLMRRDNLQEKFVAMAKRGINNKRAFVFADQDIFNIVCHDRIKFLDLKFNVSPERLESAMDFEDYRIKMQKFYGENQFDDACNDPIILHFFGKKPWDFRTIMFDDRWWEICRMSPFYEEMLYKYIASRIMADVDARIGTNTFRYNKYNYYRSKILSKLTCGKKKVHYQRKCEEIKKALGIH